MTELELNSLVFIAVERGASLFEYWLTASFALALVTYFAAGHIKGKFLYLVSIIYLLASTAFVAGWLWHAVQTATFLDSMREQGFNVAHFEHAFGIFHGAGVLAVFILGTAITLYYLWWTMHKNGNQTHNK